MNLLSRDLQKSMTIAESNLNAMQNSLQVYQLHCQSGRWNDAEAERLRMVASAEGFLDNYAAAYKRMEMERR